MKVVESAAAAAKSNIKRECMLGASYLKVNEKNLYDTKVVEDPLAKASKKTGGTMTSPKGDGEVWAEKIFRNKAGETKIFFVSKQTGKKVEDEPPSGSSRVLYLRQSYKSRNEEPKSSPSSSSKKKGNNVITQSGSRLLEVPHNVVSKRQ
eukprot:CAMPEP_0198251682 /NCGR_PEP_ID=MMETSP1447-20131203/2440_1 /TAXON_ID=420782 /ORGANISM="Chaetoceros dichaeta, Strain CCMP1751" /LENGTH=149 /DNA_ID=CAMNT_0043936763 /DNA_START=182 /DNA_END=631 /DNA_ORIENTATION=+